MDILVRLAGAGLLLIAVVTVLVGLIAWLARRASTPSQR